MPQPVATLPAVSLAREHAPNVVATQVHRGAWTRVGRGAYVAGAATMDRRERSLARIRGVHHQLTAPHVFSHASAALLWGLPLWTVPDHTDVRATHRPGARRDPTVHRHVGATPAGHIVQLGGLPATDLPLTIIDCVRTMPPLAGLVVADAGLRAGASIEALTELVRSDPHGRGMARARAVLDAADPGAESPWESATRYVLLRDGLPAPATQVRVATRLAVFWADLGWECWRVLLEYDGRTKYVDPEALVREKRRHDAIVEAGYRLLRVTREDVLAPATLLGRVHATLPPDAPSTRRLHLRAP